MPPLIVLMVRCVAVAILLKGYYWGHYRGFLSPFAPFCPLFDLIPYKYGFMLLLTGSFVISLFGVIFDGRRVRFWSFCAAALIFTGMLSTRFYFSNNKTFAGCLFFLASLMRKNDEPVFIRWQLVIMYFGAGLNKILTADWLNGIYFDYLLGELKPQEWYIWLQGMFPERWLGTGMAWATIVTEFTLAVLFLRRRWMAAGAWLAVYFHGSALLMSQSDYGIFTASLFSSYLIVLGWPAWQKLKVSGRGFWSGAGKYLQNLDADRKLKVEEKQGQTTVLEEPTGRWEGWTAIKRFLVTQPAVVLAGIVFLTISPEQYVWWRSLGVAIFLMVFCPWLNPVWNKLFTNKRI